METYLFGPKHTCPDQKCLSRSASITRGPKHTLYLMGTRGWGKAIGPTSLLYLPRAIFGIPGLRLSQIPIRDLVKLPTYDSL
jgi:hypothetical protein